MQYAEWTATYSNEGFDRTSALAQELTDADRAEGRPAPRAGYSAENWDKAEVIVRNANRYSEAAARRRMKIFRGYIQGNNQG